MITSADVISSNATILIERCFNTIGAIVQKNPSSETKTIEIWRTTTAMKREPPADKSLLNNIGPTDVS